MPTFKAQKPSPKESLADFISANELLAAWPFSRGSLYNWSHSGDFPSPTRFGPKRYLWRRSTVNEWLEARGLPPLPSPVSE